jgi:hypothetical protein
MVGCEPKFSCVNWILTLLRLDVLTWVEFEKQVKGCTYYLCDIVSDRLWWLSLLLHVWFDSFKLSRRPVGTTARGVCILAVRETTVKLRPSRVPVGVIGAGCFEVQFLKGRVMLDIVREWYHIQPRSGEEKQRGNHC